MKKCTLNMIITLSVFICILLLVTIKNAINNEDIKNILQTITQYAGILFLIYILGACVYITFSIKNDNKEALANIRKKDFKKLEEDSNKQIKKYIFLRQILNSKYNLLISLLAEGKNEKAFELLKNTKWGIYSNEVCAFKAISFLYINDIENARRLYGKVYKRKNDNLEILGLILDLIDNGIKDNKLNKTIYPIVNEICDKYEK